MTGARDITTRFYHSRYSKKSGVMPGEENWENRGRRERGKKNHDVKKFILRLKGPTVHEANFVKTNIWIYSGDFIKKNRSKQSTAVI